MASAAQTGPKRKMDEGSDDSGEDEQEPHKKGRVEAAPDTADAEFLARLSSLLEREKRSFYVVHHVSRIAKNAPPGTEGVRTTKLVFDTAVDGCSPNWVVVRTAKGGFEPGDVALDVTTPLAIGDSTVLGTWHEVAAMFAAAGKPWTILVWEAKLMRYTSKEVQFDLVSAHLNCVVHPVTSADRVITPGRTFRINITRYLKPGLVMSRRGGPLVPPAIVVMVNTPVTGKNVTVVYPHPSTNVGMPPNSMLCAWLAASCKERSSVSSCELVYTRDGCPGAYDPSAAPTRDHIVVAAMFPVDDRIWVDKHDLLAPDTSEFREEVYSRIGSVMCAAVKTKFNAYCTAETISRVADMAVETAAEPGPEPERPDDDSSDDE
jgi:hypothetical protein